ncbi:hypothetical protein BGZ57DRAFT_1008512 [Hyaloscypha finlandica]|nr:hypothetical protein BGZ57DRAFT_1008512 [Hyaloscypha finlandica]
MQFPPTTAALFYIAALANPVPSTTEAATDESYLPNPYDVTFYNAPAPYHGTPLTLTIPRPDNRGSIPPSCVPAPALQGFQVGYARWGPSLDACAIYRDTECGTRVWADGDYLQLGHLGRFTQLLTSDVELAFCFNGLTLGATFLINSGHLGAVALPESLEEPGGTPSYVFNVTMHQYLSISVLLTTEGVWKQLQGLYDFQFRLFRSSNCAT